MRWWRATISGRLDRDLELGLGLDRDLELGLGLDLAVDHDHDLDLNATATATPASTATTVLTNAATRSPIRPRFPASSPPLLVCPLPWGLYNDPNPS